MQKIIFGLSVIVACLLGVQAYQSMMDENPKDLKAQYLPGGDFILSSNNEVFDTQSLRGRPYILYFGFTTCPDICPLGLTVIRDALNSKPEFAEVPALFVSVDPERDTADRLRDYVAFFHQNIIPLRGEVVKVAAVAKQYGTYFIKAPLDAKQTQEPEDVDPLAYTVDHTAYYFLIDAEGELRRVLDHNVKAPELAEALAGIF